ncbi:hypothetical protein [Nocardioides pakistanensis]
MHTTVTTTITTRIDLDTFEPEHSVQIEAEDALPQQVIYAAVEGACKATLNSIAPRSAALGNPPISDDEY